MLKQAHVFVKGDVIGIGFRAWVKIQAKNHGITGWVRNVFNREDVFGKRGGIETLLQGDEPEVENMLKTLRKGSPISRVDNIETIHQDPKEVFENFEIKKSQSY